MGLPEPLELCIDIREVAALEQRIVREVDARNDVLRAESHLLGLGEEVVDGAVEHQTADATHRHELLGDQLRGVEHVEVEAVGEVVVEQLDAELPLRVVAALDGIPQVAPVEVGIGAVDLHGFVPEDRLQAELGLPVELHERRPPGCVDESEGVDAEALHEPERPRDRPVGHGPHHHVGRLGHEGDEVPEVVVGRLRLREPTVRCLLHGVHDIGELDRVLDEEHRDVVANQVPVAFLCVELDREPADVSGEVERTLVAGHGREPDEDRGLFARPLEQIGPGDLGERFERLEEPVRTEASCMHHPFRDPLVVEVEDLLPEVEVLEQGWSAAAQPERVLVIGDGHTLLRRQTALIALGRLVGLAARPDVTDELAAGLHVGRRCRRWFRSLLPR